MEDRPLSSRGIWPVLGQLASLDQDSHFVGSRLIDRKPDLEACLRRVLRPHDEAGFEGVEDQWMIELRQQLDMALDSLTLLEICYELDLPTDPLPGETHAQLRILFRSEAFLHYVSAYLYFGVRFLASRHDFGPYETDIEPSSCAETNIRRFPLEYPPQLVDWPRAEAQLSEFMSLDSQVSSEEALEFLDDVRRTRGESIQYELQEPSHFELWLRGLRPETTDTQRVRFETIRDGLKQWVLLRCAFYLSLQSKNVTPTVSLERTVESNVGSVEVVKGAPAPASLSISNPITSRFALADVYWIARLLRADVSSTASVAYRKDTWIHLLRFQALLHGEASLAEDLQTAEKVLRGVFDGICDLAQNSVEVTRDLEQDRLHRAGRSRDRQREERQQDEDRCQAASGRRPAKAERWRAVFDDELDEIARQRRVRHFRDPSLPPEPAAGTARASTETVVPLSDAGSAETVTGTHAKSEPASKPCGSGTGASRRKRSARPDGSAVWSKRITTDEGPRNLIGMAFSGGGIRSATFNLGVLQGLQELDLLRHIDYLSTVSGGGFIGAWLLGNVRRSAHWLGRLTDWSDSIAHLRSHSNYLAPRTGILSADTWNLFNSWFRNAFLIQMTGLVWLFTLMLATIIGLRIFLTLGPLTTAWHLPVAGCVATLLGIVFTVAIVYNLDGTIHNDPGKNRNSGAVRRLAVTPAWIGAFALAAYLWANAPMWSATWVAVAGMDQYSMLFFAAWRPWLVMLSIAGAGIYGITFLTLQRSKLHALWISPICLFVLYLELVGIFLAFRKWNEILGSPAALAFVVGPAMVIFAFTVCVLLLIGFSGRNTQEGLREWWTRFGTWLAIFAAIGLSLSGVAVYGPWIVLHFFKHPTNPAVQWTSVLSWLGTVAGGLFAGKSSKTTGDGESSSPWLEILAKVGGFLFIVGSFLLGSSLLYLLLFEIFGPDADLTSESALHVMLNFDFGQVLAAFAAALLIGLLFSWFFEINIFGLNQFYRNRIVRCYLGATRWTPGMRRANPFTKFDFKDDLKLSHFRTDSPGEDDSGEECDPYRGPFPIINCTLNLPGSSDLSLNTRHSSSFSLTPLRCGSDRPKVGYAPTWSTGGSFADGVPLGQAVAISGAAVSSNMGYNTSPLVAFLLTMFNVRLGWWFPNPGQPAWRSRGLRFSLYYMVMELFGIADEKRLFLNASDGGHFENLGIYELVRRRCKLIIACDAECDELLQFGGLGNMIRICETDFGAMIDINVKSIRPQNDGPSLAHCAVGEIKYSSGDIGHLIYLKASITGDEDVSITQYRSTHPSFPHETTANQFFSEDQFESYRKLGLHIVRSSFKGNTPGDDPLIIAEKMADVLTPAGCPSEAFLKHSTALAGIWEKFRNTPVLLPFMQELVTLGVPAVPTGVSNDELCIGLELIQLMEDVFLDLRLDDFWDHPDNRGWAIMFMRWARSPRFRMIWDKTSRTFGIRFEYFCNARLGLKRDHPIVRV
jgi:hypothetical protein